MQLVAVRSPLEAPSAHTPIWKTVFAVGAIALLAPAMAIPLAVSAIAWFPALVLLIPFLFARTQTA